MKRQSGFTLIEMVAVIIILAILAAVAFPRFTNLTAKARLSALNGLAGGLRSGVVLAKSTWLTENSGTLDTVGMNGTLVSVLTRNNAPANPEWWGVPANKISAIGLTLDSMDGFSSAMDPISGGSVAFWPNGVGVSWYCAAYYISGIVTLSVSAASSVTATTACF